MNAETLNIKMKLDIGDVLTDVKKIKTQLTGMAKSVKQSIPQIGIESKKAKSALGTVTKASKDVEDAIGDIGDEAKKSLSTVSTQSNKLAQALASVGIAGKSAKSGLNVDGVADTTDEVSSSFEEMKATMQGILALDFVSVLTQPFTNLLAKIKPTIASVQALTAKIKVLKANMKNLKDTKFALEMFDYSELGDQSEMLGKVKSQISGVRKEALLSFTSIADAVAGLTAKLVGLVAIIGAVAAAIGAVVLATNALKVSELGAEVYNNAQRAGMSAQKYQEWAYILERAGIEASELTEVVKTLTEAQVDVINQDEEFINAFKKLGISAEEVMSMSQGELWERTISALQNVGNVTDRTAIAYKIFGEDAAKLTTILNLSNAETQKLISTYNQLGGAMSQELLHNSSVLQGSLANLRVAWQGLRNTLAQAVIPAVISLVNWLTKAIVVVNVFLQKFFNINLAPAMKDLSGGVTGSTKAINGYADAVGGASAAVEKLKRVQMGFDELNVVSDPNAAASGGGGGGGTDIGSDAFSGLTDMSSSIFTEASKQVEEFEKKVSDFMDKWGWAIKAIGVAMGALSLRHILIQLASAVGLGDKVAKALSFTGIAAGISKLAGWLGTVIALLKEGNSFWAVMGAAFPKLAAAITKVGGALKAVGAFISGLSGWVVAIIAAVVAAIVFMVQKWDELKAATVSFFQEEIAPKFERIKDAALKLWDALSYLLQPIFDLIQGFKEWWIACQPLQVLGEMITAFGGVVVAILGSVVMGVINGLMSAITGLVELVSGVIELVTGLIKGFVNLVCALFTGDWSGMIESWENIKSGVVSIVTGLYDATIGIIVEFVDGIITWFVALWDELVGHSIVPDMVKAIIEWFKKLPAEIFKMITNFVKTIIDKFIELATNAGKWAGEMWSKVKKPFEGTATWFKNIFQTAWNGIKSIWSGVSSFFTGVWNTIKNIFSNVGTSIAQGITGAVKQAVNSVLSSVVNKINTFIGWINGAIGVINNIPGVNIGKISKISVPQLATGGLVVGETLARIGERGKKEVVLPLEQHTGWMDALVDKINSSNGNGQPIHLHLNVDGTELGWTVIRNINAITKQTGGLQLAL